jgi:hypothetical protein
VLPLPDRLSFDQGAGMSRKMVQVSDL